MKRIIVSLQLLNGSLVKTRKFKNPVYVGDPLNIIKLFSEYELDELSLLDISKKKIDFTLLEKIANESLMPISYGGGIRSLIDAAKLITIGFEKIVISSLFYTNINEVIKIVDSLGSQSVCIKLDFRRNFFGQYYVLSNSKWIRINDINRLIQDAMSIGAGEVLINSVNHDGCLNGPDFSLIKEIKTLCTSQIVYQGGVSSANDLDQLFEKQYDAVAASSMFIFSGPFRAVVLSYLDYKNYLRD